MRTKKSVTAIVAVIAFILMLATIVIAQGLDSRSFDTMPSVRRNSSPGTTPRTTGAPAPVCPVYGKPLTTMDTLSGNILWSFGLGKRSDGREFCPLRFSLSELTPQSYTPAELGNAVGLCEGSEIEVIKTPPTGFGAQSFVRQIKTPEVFVDIVTLSEWEFDIRFYPAGNIGPMKDGLHTAIGMPFITWKVKNPNPPSTNRIQLIKIENGLATTEEVAYDSAADSWSTINNEGETIYSKTSEIKPEDPCERTEIVVRTERGSCLCKVTRVYRGFAWGQEIVKEVEESKGEIKTTTYTFYQDPAERNRYRHVQTVTYPDGSWETYDYDQKDRFSSLTKRVVASGTKSAKPQD